MVRRGTHQRLIHRLTSGDYIVDEHAVAEAILQRCTRDELPPLAVLVPGQPSDRRPSGIGEDGAASGPRLA